MAAMLLPALSVAREKARTAMCMNNLKQIGIAISLYSAEHDGFIPKEFNDLRPYASNLDKLLICPSVKNTSNPSYRILLGGQKWNDQGIWKEIAVTELATNHRFGSNALYGDGHVEFLRERRRD
jgi:prepilin-type processing-associated H-X9-DG protein